MPVESNPTYVADLDKSLPLPGDTKSQGDDHIRNIKKVLQNTFPKGDKPFNFPKTVNVTTTPYNIEEGDDSTIFRVTTGATDKTLFLPILNTTNAGWAVAVIKVDAGTGKVIVEGPGTVVINGTPNVWLTERYSNTRILWTGYEYVTINDDAIMMIKNMAADRLLGRSDTPGPVQEIEPAPGELEIRSGKLHISSGFGSILAPGQGLLTPDSGIPIPTGDNSKIATIYYTPYTGKWLPMWDPLLSLWVMKQFSQLTLTLSATHHLAGKIYDVYAYYDETVPLAPVMRLVTGLSWYNSTPGSCIRYDDSLHPAYLIRDATTGFYTNHNDTTVRNAALTMSVMKAHTGTYLGSVLVDDVNGRYSCDRAAGQDRIWGLWNVWNRYPIAVELTFTPQTSWSISTSVGPRPSNNNVLHRITLLAGLTETPVRAELQQRISIPYNSADQTTVIIGMGWNDTNTASKPSAHYQSIIAGGSASSVHTLNATLAKTSWLGAAIVTALEYVQIDNTSPAVTFNGADSVMRTFHSG